MKSSHIKPGVKATSKLNGRDQVVTVMGEAIGSARSGVKQWIVRTPAGNQVYRTARQLREVARTGHYPQEAILAYRQSLDARVDEIRATRADGIDAVEDRAHARARRGGLAT